ncbi:alkaline phosphatase [Radiomyces spectabilis]|uniref:alkaline phosphatase n=1 Tax=Radiomyces spectabilis TaxID=64574 RepID=UPI00221E5719|nr:alkaline phosphatase [Radiomyces spectabilis]KAI8366107.1 alkaline phosphatase [Radiomyces spectabilis]
MSEPLLKDIHEETQYDDNEEESIGLPPQQRPRNIINACIYNRLVLASVICAVVLISITVAAMATPMNMSAWKERKRNIYRPRNIIMMISDGLGPASVSFARTYYQYVNNLTYDHPLPLDTIHVGQSRTRSSSTLVTDSAAGATAYSCGIKTYNGAVGVDPQGQPCGTLLESAKHRHNMKTGLVATSRITHATPASFSAHVKDRDDENAIALQQLGENPLGRSVDLMFGGGVCQFLPKNRQGCRSDGRDLLTEAQQKYGWKTVLHSNRTAFDQLPTSGDILPTMALFSSEHMSYEIDRKSEEEPSLTEMSDKALKILSDATKGSDTGFFLMIEGSRIDMAAHSNDAATHLHDILEYQNVIQLVKQFVDEHPDTMLISTSDHETGGLSLARQVSPKYPKYLWYPDVLTRVKQSSIALAEQIMRERKLDDRQYLQSILRTELGIDDFTEQEMQTLMKQKSTKSLDQYLADMVSVRAQLGWATHGHSAVDVNLYAYGRGSEALHGNLENTYIGNFIADKLDLDLQDLTKKLNSNNPSFHLTQLDDREKLKYNEHLDHYLHHPQLLHHLSFA